METKYRNQIVQTPEYTRLEQLPSDLAVRALGSDTTLHMAPSPHVPPHVPMWDQPHVSDYEQAEEARDASRTVLIVVLIATIAVGYLGGYFKAALLMF